MMDEEHKDSEEYYQILTLFLELQNKEAFNKRIHELETRLKDLENKVIGSRGLNRYYFHKRLKDRMIEKLREEIPHEEEMEIIE